MCPAYCFCTRLRKTEVQNFSLFDEVFDCTGNIFDGNFWIYPVLVIKINMVGSKTPKGAFHHFPDMLWPAIQTTTWEVKTKFGCDDDFVTKGSQGFSYKFFVHIWTVNFSCIKEGDAFFIGCTNDLNALVFVCGRSIVSANAHTTCSYFRDF